MLRQWQIALCALRMLSRFPLRSSLLASSAAVGVIGVVCSVNYGAGGTRQVLDQIRGMGTNVLIVTPTESRAVAGRARTGTAVTTLVGSDYSAIRREIPALTRSSAIVSDTFRVKAGDLSKVTSVWGCEPDYFAIRNWQAASGGLFEEAADQSAARVAVIGRTVAIDLFPEVSPIGQRLMINRVPFAVVGVLSERGQGLDVSNEDNQVYVPLHTAMRRLMNTDHFSGLVLEVRSLDQMDSAALQTAWLLRVQHHIRPGQVDDFQIQNQKTLLDTELAASARLNFFLRWIAASALTVAGLGMVAISWIAIRERTREIGTRRALGATARDIWLQILFECGVLALAGAWLGILISWMASRLLNHAAGLPSIFETGAAAIAFGAALSVDLLFAMLPSRKAASVSPTEALRYE